MKLSTFDICAVCRMFTKHILAQNYLESHSKESNTVDSKVTECGNVRKNTEGPENEKDEAVSAAFLMLIEETFLFQQALDRAQSS